jgi:hypothetical protein
MPFAAFEGASIMAKATRMWARRASLAALAAGVLPAAAAGPPAATQPAATQPVATQPADVPARRTAYLAARADAVEDLAEQVGGLHITAEATVKDFLGGSETLAAALEAFLSSLPDAGRPSYPEQGACKLGMSVRLDAVQAALREIHHRHYEGDKFAADAFDGMAAVNDVDELEVTGLGTVRKEFLDAGAVTKRAGRDAALSAKAAKFWAAHCRPIVRRSLERAARQDAVRRLAERIEAVRITDEATLRQFVATADAPNVDARAFLKGARMTAVRYHDDALVVEVDMDVELRTVYATLRSWGRRHFKGDRAKIGRLEELAIRAEDGSLRETGVGVPAEKDMLQPTPRMRKAAELARAMPLWAPRSLEAVGEASIDAEAAGDARTRAAASRAAQMDARLKLAEQVRGLPVPPSTTVGQLAADDGQFRAALAIFRQSARALPQEGKDAKGAGKVIVAVETDLKPLWNAILHRQK